MPSLSTDSVAALAKQSPLVVIIIFLFGASQFAGVYAGNAVSPAASASSAATQTNLELLNYRLGAMEEQLGKLNAKLDELQSHQSDCRIRTE